MAKKNPNVKYGRCNNIGNCPKATSKEIIEIPLGEDFVCPNGCGPLTLVTAKKNPWKKIAVGGGILLVLAAGGGSLLLMGNDPKSEPEPVSSPGQSKEPYEVVDEAVEEESEDVNVESMTFMETEKEMQLKPKEEKQLNIDCTPGNANEGIGWKSSDEAVAAVSESGVVKALKAGQASITAKADRSKTTATIKVTVKDENSGDGNTPGTVNLGYATYEGPRRNGRPHGIGGKLTFKASHVIDLKKMPAEYVNAHAGDYMVNVKFDNGRLVQGELHCTDGTRKWINI